VKIGMVGYGVVGTAIGRMVSSCADHELIVFRRFQPRLCDPWRRDAINNCDLVFLSVPTPSNDRGSDFSIADECASWIKAPLSIRSPVTAGTVERLTAITGNTKIAFSPEYLGESPFHRWPEASHCGFLIVGGPNSVFVLSGSLYDSCLNRRPRYYHTPPRTAELSKYAENCFLATKVAL
jgi:UDPglucose 6-dehydrogenase